MTRLQATLALALAATAAAPAVAAGLIEDYHVNAQYRGGVKKGFRDIGTGKAAYESLGGASFRVKVKASVEHPREPKEYSFSISQVFEVTGNTIRTTATETKEMNPAAQQHEHRITEVIPFTYLARTLPPPADTGGDRSRNFNFEGQQFTLRYASTEKNLEVSLYRGSELVGKFFEESQPSGQMARLEKFRVPLPSEGLVVSFVVTTSMASAH